MFSRSPKTLAVNPAVATGFGPFFRLALARAIPRMEKGIVKDVIITVPAPSQNERENKTLVSPHKRLKNPVIPDWFPKISLFSIPFSPFCFQGLFCLIHYLFPGSIIFSGFLFEARPSSLFSNFIPLF